MDIYFGGFTYRRMAGNMEQYFGRETTPTTVYRWVRELMGKPMKVSIGGVWVVDEIVVNVGGQNYRLFAAGTEQPFKDWAAVATAE